MAAVPPAGPASCKTTLCGETAPPEYNSYTLLNSFFCKMGKLAQAYMHVNKKISRWARLGDPRPPFQRLAILTRQ